MSQSLGGFMFYAIFKQKCSKQSNIIPALIFQNLAFKCSTRHDNFLGNTMYTLNGIFWE